MRYAFLHEIKVKEEAVIQNEEASVFSEEFYNIKTSKEAKKKMDTTSLDSEPAATTVSESAESEETSEDTSADTSADSLFDFDFYDDETEATAATTATEAEATEAPSLFDDSDYDGINKKVRTSIDSLNKMSLSYKQIVDIKEARTDISFHRNYIVAKNKGKTTKVDEMDTIYKTWLRIPRNMRAINSKRLGFVIAGNKKSITDFNIMEPIEPSIGNFKNKNEFNKAQVVYERKLRKYKKALNKYAGVLNERYLVYKKRPFNYENNGILMLDDNTNYVEVVVNRGYKWLVLLAAVLIVLGFISSFVYNAYIKGDSSPFKDWHFNKNLLTLYKTAEQTEYENREIEISLNATPYMDENGDINLELSSYTPETDPVEIDKLNYIVRLKDEAGNLVYESNRIKVNQGLDSVNLNINESNELKTGENKISVECDTYKSSKYLGTINSDLTLTVLSEEQQQRINVE